MNHFGIYILVACLALTVVPTTGLTAANPKTPRCASILQQIDRVNQRMRQPYGAKEGEYLRSRLKKLSDSLYECRKSRSGRAAP